MVMERVLQFHPDGWLLGTREELEMRVKSHGGLPERSFLPGKASLFVLFKPLTDWLRLTH